MFLKIPFQLGIFYDLATPSATRRLSPWGRGPGSDTPAPQLAAQLGGARREGPHLPGAQQGRPRCHPDSILSLPILHLPNGPASPQPNPGGTAEAFGGGAEEWCSWGGIARRGDRGEPGGCPCPARPAPANDSILQLSALARRAPPARSPPELPPRPEPPGHGSNTSLLSSPPRGHSRNCRRRQPPGTARRRRRRARRRSPCGAPSPRRR